MKEEKQPEARSEVAPAKNETTEKTEFSMADFPTQFGKPNRKKESFFHEGLSAEYPEITTDHGQVTGKLYHLRLRFACTLFCNYKAGRELTPYW
jgi:hypothetical protein